MLKECKKIDLIQIKAQSRLKESLKKILGPGLLQTPQRSQHAIHPYDLKVLIDLRRLNR